MIRRVQTVFLVLWIAVLAVVMQLVISNDEQDERIGAYVDGYTAEKTSYVIDMRSSGSYLYKIERDGKAEIIKTAVDLGFETFDAILPADEGPAVVISAPAGQTGSDERTYQIVLLTDTLNAMRVSPVFELPTEVYFSTVSHDAGIWYISGIGNSGRGAFVYSINDSEFSDVAPEVGINTTEEKKAKTLVSIYSQRAAEGVSYTKVTFNGSVLFMQADNEALSDVFKDSETARKAYETANIGLKWRNRMFSQEALIFLIYILIGAFIFIINIFMHRFRPLLTRSISIILASLIVVSLLGFLETYNINNCVKQQTLSMLSEELVTLETDVERSGLLPEDVDTLFLNEDYASLRDVISAPMKDVLLLRTIDGRNIISKSAAPLMYIQDMYGQNVYNVYDQAVRNGSAQGMARIQGKEYAVAARSMFKDYNRQVIIAGLYETKSADFKDLYLMWIVLIVMAAAVMIYVICSNVISYAHLAKLRDTMVKVSGGSGDMIDIPEEKPAELAGHWDALGEIASVFRRVNYSAYQVYEAYFRFAPKKIETFLEKTSISEVRCGDIVMFSGTEAILNISGDMMGSVEGIDDMNDLIMIMERHQEKRDGILISSDVSSGIVKLVFKEGMQTLSFGVDFWHDVDALWPGGFTTVGIVVHYGKFRYGVVGTTRQSMVFMDSAESRLIAKYSAWLRDLGLGLLITDSVVKYEGLGEEDMKGLRYIGFIEEDGVKLDLYEVLDANTSSVRLGKKANLSKYNEALEYFKSQDFYFARNTFSEILKETPEDAVVKWYLFESEHYLNQDSCGDLLRLHMD